MFSNYRVKQVFVNPKPATTTQPDKKKSVCCYDNCQLGSSKTKFYIFIWVVTSETMDVFFIFDVIKL